jgi:probable rRNA maturation factor
MPTRGSTPRSPLDERDIHMSTPLVSGFDESGTDVDVNRWVELATEALVHEGITGGELTLVFVDETAMAELHLEHMGEPGPTDVLSFPIDLDDDGPTSGETGEEIPSLLGDIVVCPSVAAANAPEHAGSVDDELALLVVHGVLHVLGHDHAEVDETAHMRARERSVLEACHWHGPAPASFAARQ